MEINFTIPGEPTGKGRPRFIHKGNFTKVITPENTVYYENLVKISYQSAADNFYFPEEAFIEMEITAYFSIPKSASKVRKRKMLLDWIRPTKKPDLDNIAKTIADSLNKIAYVDDSHITDMTVRKRYAEIPKVEVTIREIELSPQST